MDDPKEWIEICRKRDFVFQIDEDQLAHDDHDWFVENRAWVLEQFEPLTEKFGLDAQGELNRLTELLEKSPDRGKPHGSAINSAALEAIASFCRPFWQQIKPEVAPPHVALSPGSGLSPRASGRDIVSDGFVLVPRHFLMLCQHLGAYSALVKASETAGTLKRGVADGYLHAVIVNYSIFGRPLLMPITGAEVFKQAVDASPASVLPFVENQVGAALGGLAHEFGHLLFSLENADVLPDEELEADRYAAAACFWTGIENGMVEVASCAPMVLLFAVLERILKFRESLRGRRIDSDHPPFMARVDMIRRTVDELLSQLESESFSALRSRIDEVLTRVGRLDAVLDATSKRLAATGVRPVDDDWRLRRK